MIDSLASSHQGYYRFPTLSNNQIVFTAEDDLWRVAAEGGRAERLTTNLSTATTPCFSPDGKWIAFTGSEEGPEEVFVLPAAGGPTRRITFLGSQTRVVGWEGDEIIFASNYAQPPRQPAWLYRVRLDGTGLERLPYGPASRYARNGNMVVLGRKTREPAYWKRYRGGTAGEILIDRDGSGNFSHLVALKGNLADPLFVGDRIFFLSDHEGIGNVFSVLPDGSDLKQHTFLKDFYARNASTDGQRIVFHAGADLYILDPANNETRRVEVEFHSSRIQTSRRFESAGDFLESANPSFDGARLAITTRGKIFTMGCWEGAVLQHGIRQGPRYRLATYLKDGQRILVACDSDNEDHLEIHDVTGTNPVRKLNLPDLGRPMEIRVSPKEDKALVTNHRNQLFLIDLPTEEMKLIDQNRFDILTGACWAPDGRWIAYPCALDRRVTVIKVYSLETGEIHTVTKPVLVDSSPSFDSEGKYLFFLSRRLFNPVYDNLQQAAGFPSGMRPYVIPLRKDVPSPFIPEPEGFAPKKKEDEAKQNENSAASATVSGTTDSDKKSEPEGSDLKPISIDFEGIEERVICFPVSEGLYTDLQAGKGRVFYRTQPVEGTFDFSLIPSPQPKGTLKVYDFKKREESTFAEKVSSFMLSSDRSALVYYSGKKVRVVAADAEKLEDKEDTTRKIGWIDLGRIKLSIEPRAEWRQMLQEAWRLQRDYFWTEDMSQVDWKAILERYLPLVDRISARTEFADLVWEMQGELGTSHCYEMGGDYRDTPKYNQGFLGADLSWSQERNAWKIDRIVRGDPWDPDNASPFLRPGVQMKDGMLLLAIGGQPLSASLSPQQLLVNLPMQEISLLVAESDGSASRTITVKTMASEVNLRYRDWVERNRQIVHEKSGGKLGYIHIPDMGPRGFAEFHRSFLVELDHEGLVVDIRFNGGGNVSGLLLEKLARKRLGFDTSRWFGTFPYPVGAPSGPMVCLTNEFAGSDGDIFSQSFKLLKLGKLLGKRTWGGVIGIWPRNTLVDGTVTTQPEFSFWFREMGWGVENYGVDPDLEMDILPQDWRAGKDPQLELAIQEGLKAIEENPPLNPDLGNRPSLKFP